MTNSASRPTSVDVAIIGAGPAGLTAAYLLTKEGYRVTVIEKDPDYVGGISRTVEHEGFRFDIGGHRFFFKSPGVVEIWDAVARKRPRLKHSNYCASRMPFSALKKKISHIEQL